MLRLSSPGLILCLCLCLAACAPAAALPAASAPTLAAATLAAAAPAAAATTPAAASSAGPVPTWTAAPQPSATPRPSPSPTPDARRAALTGLLASPHWPGLGLPDDEAARWTAYRDGSVELDPAELAGLDDFLAQWQAWQARLVNILQPPGETVALRAKTFEPGEPGGAAGPAAAQPRQVLYAVNAAAANLPPDAEQLYLLSADRPTPLTLPLAPQIEGLRQAISWDGTAVEYLDRDGRALLRADAALLGVNVSALSYQGQYTAISGYPRFSSVYPEIKARFFLLEKFFGTGQARLLDEAFARLDQEPALAPLKQALFSSEFPVIFYSGGIPQNQDAVGLAGRSGYIEIDSDRLLSGATSTEYLLVMLHEATHLYQFKRNFNLREPCRSEIGSGGYPDGFDDFTAEQLLAALDKNEIGSMHIELWAALQLQAPKALITADRYAIQVSGHGIWSYCP